MYVIIGMFVLASIIATYACFEPLVMWSYNAIPGCPVLQLPRFNLYLCIIHMELRQFVLLLLSVALSVVWVVFRNENWAWILQDFLGILFSINMLKVLRLPSLMICTILLSILFFYDIFFVFITPLFTKVGWEEQVFPMRQTWITMLLFTLFSRTESLSWWRWRRAATRASSCRWC